jgi:hypothetical protein
MICDTCGCDSSTYSVRLTAAGPRRCCRVCRSPRLRQSVANPFANLRLEHAHDELGNPVEVTSLRQLQEAEKRYKFRSLVANERSADFDKPPQHRQKDLFEATTEAGGWLYPEIVEALIPELREAGEI